VVGFLVFVLSFMVVGHFLLPAISRSPTITWFVFVLPGAMGAAAAVMLAMAASSRDDRSRAGLWALVVGAGVAAYLLGLMWLIERHPPWRATGRAKDIADLESLESGKAS
jgi:hypothetical protein